MTVKIITNYFIYVEKDHFCVMHFTANEGTQEHVIAVTPNPKHVLLA